MSLNEPPERKRVDCGEAVARHTLAALCSALFLAALQLTAFAALKTIDIISYRNLTGGLELISAVLLATCAGTAAALSYVLIAGAFALLAFKVRLPVWCSPVLVWFGSAGAALAIGWTTHGHLSLKLLALAGLLSGVFSVGFTVYWLAARFAGPFVAWLRGNSPPQ